MRAILAALLLTTGCEAGREPAPAGNDPTAAPVANTAQPAEASRPLPAPQAEPAAHPCLVQDGQPVRAAAIRGVGTEPFWGARTQGRCVTYSTPEDQAGTRVWAKVESGPAGTVWTGALRGKRFELRVQPMPGCSDGMSDTRYPFEAKLLVDGEERRGCAEPASTGR